MITNVNIVLTEIEIRIDKLTEYLNRPQVLTTAQAEFCKGRIHELEGMKRFIELRGT